MLTLVTWSTGRNDLAKKYLDWSCVFGWLSAKWWVFMRGNVCGGLSGNFVIRSASKQAPYALLIGSLHAKSPPAHNASNMFQPIITSGKEINILFRINSITLLAVVRSGKHARRSVWTFQHLGCYLDTPHPPHSHMPAFHSEFSAIWGEQFFRCHSIS